MIRILISFSFLLSSVLMAGVDIGETLVDGVNESVAQQTTVTVDESVYPHWEEETKDLKMNIWDVPEVKSSVDISSYEMPSVASKEEAQVLSYGSQEKLDHIQTQDPTLGMIEASEDILDQEIAYY